MTSTIVDLTLAAALANRGVSAFIREHTAEILECWESRACRALAVARALDHVGLLDELPVLLRSVADVVDGIATQTSTRLDDDVAERHARQRLEQGYDLGEVVREYAILRECLVDQWQRTVAGSAAERLDELRVVHHALDQAISASVERYAAAHNRTLTALDKIAAAGAVSRDLDDLLLRLLGVLQESLPAVDTGAVWLADGERLRLRAAIDGAPAQPCDVELAFGVGFAGAVAHSRAPLVVSDAAHDPRAQQDPTSHPGLDALYLVPMIEGEQLVGVLQIGSLTAPSFSHDDRQLFDTSAHRATSLIRQHMLGESALRATRLREQVLAIVSHDLRSPLTAVRLAANVLEQDSASSDPRRRRPIDAILRSTTRMEHLINDLVDVGRLQRGGFAIAAQRIELSSLLADAVATHTPAAAEQGVALSCSAHPGELYLLADAGRLVQVIANLVGNAIKFASRGDAIVCASERDGDGVRVSVTDTGPGIAPSDAAHIFEQYWSAARHAHHGAGLGLYICKGIVEAHGGRIWLESTPGSGSTFSFWLPLPTGS